MTNVSRGKAEVMLSYKGKIKEKKLGGGGGGNIILFQEA